MRYLFLNKKLSQFEKTAIEGIVPEHKAIKPNVPHLAPEMHHSTRAPIEQHKSPASGVNEHAKRFVSNIMKKETFKKENISKDLERVRGKAYNYAIDHLQMSEKEARNFANETAKALRERIGQQLSAEKLTLNDKMFNAYHNTSFFEKFKKLGIGAFKIIALSLTAKEIYDTIVSHSDDKINSEIQSNSIPSKADELKENLANEALQNPPGSKISEALNKVSESLNVPSKINIKSPSDLQNLSNQIKTTEQAMKELLEMNEELKTPGLQDQLQSNIATIEAARTAASS